MFYLYSYYLYIYKVIQWNYIMLCYYIINSNNNNNKFQKGMQTFAIMYNHSK